MIDPVLSQSRAVLLGIACGEALSWSSLSLRSDKLPAWLSRNRREIEADLIRENITSVPKPFSLNQSPDPLKPAPGDFSEWSAWTAALLIENQGNLTHEILHSAWEKLAANRKQIHGRISIQAALRNIESGMTAPQSGRFNPHYFDDAALARTAVIGVSNPGNEARARALAELDASFTQFEDGVWSAAAVATLFSLACRAESVEQMIQACIFSLPADSLSGQSVHAALEGNTSNDTSILTTALYLNSEVCNQIYSYGNIAHEILACLLVILKNTAGDFDKMVACAALLPSTGSGLLALCTGLAALLNPNALHESALVDKYLSKLEGNSLPEMKDVDLMELSQSLDIQTTQKNRADREDNSKS
ncbi:MAG: ADP-ribosylglycohydrolase family protein [Candidatus Marinimicrobia bacterium]|nr:ADP-ribosylglycohydrolase family protein [Candidatus Neomarinimicrobiota bacterium]